MGGQRPDKKKVQTHAMMMWVMTMTMATKTQNGILTSVTYGVYKSKLVGCPAETILQGFLDFVFPELCLGPN